MSRVRDYPPLLSPVLRPTNKVGGGVETYGAKKSQSEQISTGRLLRSLRLMDGQFPRPLALGDVRSRAHDYAVTGPRSLVQRLVEASAFLVAW